MSIHKPTYKKLSEEIINLLKLKKVDEIEKIINEIHPLMVMSKVSEEMLVMQQFMD